MFVRSGAFLRQKRTLDVFAQANRQTGAVYLVSRFDDDDSTICTFMSMGYRNAPLPSGFGGVEPVTQVDFRRTTKLPQGALPLAGYTAPFGGPSPRQSVVAANDQGGGHAEELFIRKLPRMFVEYGPVSKIDVFISRIPCADRSAAWLLPGPHGAPVLLPKGCANKLNAVIRLNERMTWRIWWQEAYDNPRTQAASVAALAQLSGVAIVSRYTG